MRIGKSLGED